MLNREAVRSFVNLSTAAQNIVCSSELHCGTFKDDLISFLVSVNRVSFLKVHGLLFVRTYCQFLYAYCPGVSLWPIRSKKFKCFRFWLCPHPYLSLPNQPDASESLRSRLTYTCPLNYRQPDRRLH